MSRLYVGGFVMALLVVIAFFAYQNNWLSARDHADRATGAIERSIDNARSPDPAPAPADQK